MLEFIISIYAWERKDNWTGYRKNTLEIKPSPSSTPLNNSKDKEQTGLLKMVTKVEKIVHEMAIIIRTDGERIFGNGRLDHAKEVLFYFDNAAKKEVKDKEMLRFLALRAKAAEEIIKALK